MNINFVLFLGGIILLIVGIVVSVLLLGPKYLNKEKMQNKTAEFLFFYTDWCPHCTSAKPSWNSFKDKTKTVNGYNITYKEINCTKETPESEMMMEKYKVEGFPTIKLLVNGRVIDFEEKPTEQNLTQFVNSSLS